MAQPPTSSHPQLLVTYREAARLLGNVSIRHIERLVSRRALKRKGAGRARRIVHQSILAYIEREGDDG